MNVDVSFSCVFGGEYLVCNQYKITQTKYNEKNNYKLGVRKGICERERLRPEEVTFLCVCVY